MPTIPNPSFTTINYDTNRMNFDTELIDSNLWIQRLKEIKEYDTLRNMQQAFRDIMTCYAKRNSAYVYNQSQSQILRRILEVVPDAKKAFWIYACLIETILPINFFSHTLYPQTLLQFTETILRGSDKDFFTEMGDSIRLFCLKSFYSLFTNMMDNQEIAFSILDLLFLYGSPTTSKTFFDDDIEFPMHVKKKVKLRKEQREREAEQKSKLATIGNELSRSAGSVTNMATQN